ncbi:MAG: hypothetical protein JEZ07_17715 [Phycisphaerae bacterium]|nr:hypothetical protein [Phycisphaerae bacterium]
MMENNKYSEGLQRSIAEIRNARQQAELLRDQLLCAYHQLQEQDKFNPDEMDQNTKEGQESLRLAIKAADHAIASIDQGLANMGRVEYDRE